MRCNMTVGNFLHWIDRNGNKYGYYVGRNEDQKFQARIYNRKGDLKKERIFSKRHMAKKWAYEKFRKANNHQAVVILDRQKRKEQREAEKPKLSKEEFGLLHAMKKKHHYEILEIKCNRKIKSLNTRKKTYQKRINYYNKIINKITTTQKNKTRRELIKNE